MKEQLYTHSGSPATHSDLIKVTDMSKIAANAAIEDAADRPAQLNALADRTREAKEALLEAIQGIGAATELFEPASARYLTSIRQFRMSAIAEVASATKPLEDLRKFFLSDAHDKEVARLREFIDLCERLKALKDSGFLDAVADTMLKLA